jgi:chromosome partitioning protein
MTKTSVATAPSLRPAKIISVYNEKGGAGKTTLACQLAGTLGERGYDVLVGDLDPQRTASRWLAVQGGANFFGSLWDGSIYKGEIKGELGKQRQRYDVIVLDCPPSVNTESTSQALLLSDLALIPTKLNATDTDALAAAKLLAKRAMDQLELGGFRLEVRVVPMAARMHLKDHQSAVRRLSTDDRFPVLQTAGKSPQPCVLHDRQAYSRSMLLGGTVTVVKDARDAVAEVSVLTDAVLSLLKLPASIERSEEVAE